MGDIACVAPVHGGGAVGLPMEERDVNVRELGEGSGKSGEVGGARNVGSGIVRATRVGGTKENEVDGGARAGGHVEAEVAEDKGRSGDVP